MPLGKLVETLAQPALEIFQDQRHEAHVGDFVSRERFANIFRPQRSQVHDRGAAGERADKADHKIDRVVRGQNAEVSHARPKRIERGERDALFQIIFVGEHAALRAATSAGGIDDARASVAFARTKIGAR